MAPSILSALPTDSLYKFLALAGLIVLAASLVVPFYYRKKLRFQVIEARRDHEKLKARAAFTSELIPSRDIRSTLAAFEETAKRLTSQNDARSQKALDLLVSDVRKYAEKVEGKADEYGREVLERRLEAIENECNLKKVEFLTSQLDLLRRTQQVGITIGSLMTLSGFALWYVQVQQYTDEIQRLQLRQAELQVAKAEREEREAREPAPDAPHPAIMDVLSAMPEGAGPADDQRQLLLQGDDNYSCRAAST